MYNLVHLSTSCTDLIIEFATYFPCHTFYSHFTTTDVP